MKYRKGETLYCCDCWRDGEFHIGIIEVVSGEDKVDAMGRNRGCRYEVHAKNFSRDNKREFSLKESVLDSEYFRSAVEAVGSSLAHLFDSYRRSNPSALMESLFGAERKVKVTMEVLPKVIRELQEFQKMFAEAANLDATKKVENKDKETDDAN